MVVVSADISYCHSVPYTVGKECGREEPTVGVLAGGIAALKDQVLLRIGLGCRLDGLSITLGLQVFCGCVGEVMVQSVEQTGSITWWVGPLT